MAVLRRSTDRPDLQRLTRRRSAPGKIDVIGRLQGLPFDQIIGDFAKLGRNCSMAAAYRLSRTQQSYPTTSIVR